VFRISNDGIHPPNIHEAKGPPEPHEAVSCWITIMLQVVL